MVKFTLDYGRGIYKVTINSQDAGTLEPKEDGYWDWYPLLKPGYIPSTVLRQIANYLDNINKDWDEEGQKL